MFSQRKHFLCHYLTLALFLGCTAVHCYWDTINCAQYILLVVSLMCYYTTASKFVNVADFVGQYFGQ